MTVAIVDCGSGNLHSAAKAFERAAREAADAQPIVVTNDPDVVRNADRIVLPGVGAFHDAMTNLRQLNLLDPFVANVKSGTPALGICLGMHLLFSESEEFGLHEGLNLIGGRVVRLPGGLRVPHMGWNQLHAKRSNGLTQGVQESSFVYFVHSYYVEPESAEIVLATTDYGIEFPAIVHWKNIWATQFHPEKSQHVGERLLDNFARL